MGRRKKGAPDEEFIIAPGAPSEEIEVCVVKPGRTTLRLLEAFIRKYADDGLVLIDRVGSDTFIIRTTRAVREQMCRLGFDVVVRDGSGRARGPEMTEEERKLYTGETPSPHAAAPETRGPIRPLPHHSALTAAALGLKPGDWDDPDYRAAYCAILIIAPQRERSR